MNKRLISIVIPVYNSKLIILDLVKHLLDYSASRNEENYEFIFVDDCSSDDSWSLIKIVKERHSEIRAIKFARNFGQQPATIAGLSIAKGNLMITMDDDLQHDPFDIPMLIEAYDKNPASHIVIAHLKNKQTSFFKRKASDLYRYVNGVALNKPKGLYLSAFRLIDRFSVDKMLGIETAFPFLPALMFSITKEIVNVEIEHKKRYLGESNYGFIKMVKVSSRLFINNSTVLLDLIAFVGVLSASVSFLGILIISLTKLLGINFAAGWVSLISSIYLVGGLILFSLGIIGKYLQRILVEVTNVPNYVIEEII